MTDQRPEEVLLEQLKVKFPYHQWQPYGSRYTVNPPPTDTDLDVLVYDPSRKMNDTLKLDWGFEPCSVFDYDQSKFTAFRRGDLNVMVYHDLKAWNANLVARDICKRLNLKDREDRVFVHKEIRELAARI